LKPKWGPKQYKTHRIAEPESIYRRDPSPEVDEAWAHLSDVAVLTVTEQQIRDLGKDPRNAVKAPESWGHGSDAYLVHLDGIHLIHCLNMLRKGIFNNYEYYHPNGTDFFWHSHMSHCVDAIRNRLMCQPSVELMTYNWVEGQRKPFPDFTTTGQCWDFEQLQKWQEKHKVSSMSQEKWNALRIPEDDKPLPSPILTLETLDEAAVAGKDWTDTEDFPLPSF
jgi:hypothetical protein